MLIKIKELSDDERKYESIRIQIHTSKIFLWLFNISFYVNIKYLPKRFFNDSFENKLITLRH